MKKLFYAFGSGLFAGGVGVYAYIRYKYMLLKRFRFKWKHFKLNTTPSKDWEFPED